MKIPYSAIKCMLKQFTQDCPLTFLTAGRYHSHQLKICNTSGLAREKRAADPASEYILWMETVCPLSFFLPLSLSVLSRFSLCSLSVLSPFSLCSLSVLSLFSLCSLSVLSPFSLCSLSVLFLFSLCSLSLCSLSLCSLSVLSLCSLGSLSVFSLFSLGSLSVLSLFSLCSLSVLSVLSLFSLCSLSVLSPFSLCSLSLFSLRSLSVVSPFSLCALSLFSLCSLSVLSPFSLCSLPVLSPFSLCSLSILSLSLFSLRSLSVLSLFSLCSLCLFSLCSFSLLSFFLSFFFPLSQSLFLSFQVLHDECTVPFPFWKACAWFHFGFCVIRQPHVSGWPRTIRAESFTSGYVIRHYEEGCLSQQWAWTLRLCIKPSEFLTHVSDIFKLYSHCQQITRALRSEKGTKVFLMTCTDVKDQLGFLLSMVSVRSVRDLCWTSWFGVFRACCF